MVDSSTLSWEQIIEIRNDSEAQQDLKQLKDFVFENFAGKPLSYVESKLGTYILKYEAAAAKHGADIQKSVLSTVGSKEVLGASASGLTSFLMGVDVSLATQIGTAIGVSIGLAGALVEVRYKRQSHELDNLTEPIRFLVNLKNLVQD